jgi:hypothetical protein
MERPLILNALAFWAFRRRAISFLKKKKNRTAMRNRIAKSLELHPRRPRGRIPKTFSMNLIVSAELVELARRWVIQRRRVNLQKKITDSTIPWKRPVTIAKKAKKGSKCQVSRAVLHGLFPARKWRKRASALPRTAIRISEMATRPHPTTRLRVSLMPGGILSRGEPLPRERITMREAPPI